MRRSSLRGVPQLTQTLAECLDASRVGGHGATNQNPDPWNVPRLEGKNIVVEYLYAEGKPDRLRKLALVRLKVDVIVTAGPAATRSAKEATASIPIVMAQVSDPIGGRFVASLARPGGKITDLSAMTPEIAENNWSF